MFAGTWAGRRVLVTGHTGFKGAWLSEWLLALGAEVSGLALPPETTPNLFSALGLADRVRHHVADIRDAAAVAAIMSTVRPEVVFHLAAQPLVRRSYREPKETWDINVGGTVNLLEAVRGTPGVRVCLVVTSDKCYENREWHSGYREDDALGGHDPYSASKGATELAVASWRRSYAAATGVRFATARAGNVIGGGDWSEDRIVTDFILAMREGRPLRLRHPLATRPWQHVLEPLSGYLTLGQRLLGEDGERWAEAWNLGPSDAGVATVRELARLLVGAWGSSEVIEDPVSGQPHEAGLLRLDCGKANARLGWYGAWDLATAVEQTVAWYRDFYAGVDAASLTRAHIDAYAAGATSRRLAWVAAARHGGPHAGP